MAFPLTGLVSYWKLDGNSNDAVTTNNGTDNSIVYSAGNGIIVQGAGMNGSGSYISVASNASLQITAALSISCWVKATNFSSRRWLVTKHNNDISNAEYGLAVDNSSKLIFFSANTTNYYYIHTTTQTVGTGAWHHCVVTRAGNASGSTVKLYIDGTSYAFTVDSNNPSFVAAGTYPFQIGAFNGNNENMLGAIDEVGIWNTELSAADVTALYNSGAGLAYPATNTTLGFFNM